MSVECCVREEENSLGFYVANSEENLIKGERKQNLMRIQPR